MTLEKTFQSKDVEEKYYPLWEKSGVFAANVKSNNTPYTIPMPPPNVTGSLHMGHALNMTLQDILSRYERMQGKDVLWQPGTDHAGIATQMVVERLLAKEGKSRHDLGREGFLKRVWEWKAESGGMITTQLRRLGATPDWERERFTMDEGLNKAVRKVFVQLYKEKLIYRDKRLVNWDPKLHTAISDLEVEQKETKAKMWHFRYPIEGKTEQFIVIATTRPETMLGDTAVAVHPDDPRYKDLIGKFAVLPIVGRMIPIVADEYADPEKGSGAVKITPAHDFNDFEVGKRHKLPMIDVLDKDAKINKNAPEEYQGLDRYDARKKILAEMEALELIEKVEDITNMIPYGDRSGVVIEPMLMDQWYVDAATLAKPAIKAVEDGRTQFVPATWTKTYYEWMRNIQPWCISRQIWWGHQIPAWFDDNGKIYVAETEEEAQKEAGAGVKLTRDADVLDTWFSSALWPFSTLGWPDMTEEVKRYYPAETLITGFDIIFFWVARMMMMGIHFMGDVPFKTVYIHGLVRDEKGQKMSKSKGNIIDPLELIDSFGTDALRFTICSLTGPGRDVKLGSSRVQDYRGFITKLWNAARFCEMNGVAIDPSFDPAAAKLPLTRWLLDAANAAVAEATAALEVYRFDEYAAAGYRFVWNTYCDWFLEFAKPALAEGADPVAAAEVRATAAHVLGIILRMLHPAIPYVTEELWDRFGYGAECSLIGESWPVSVPVTDAAAARAELDWVVRLIGLVRSVRTEMNVPPSQPSPILLRDATAETLARADRWIDAIKRLARASEVRALNGDLPKGSAQAVLDEATVVLPLEGIIDLKAERTRLGKDRDKAAAEARKFEQKLANADFIKRAPEEIVEENRARVVAYLAEVARLEAAMERIQ